MNITRISETYSPLGRILRDGRPAPEAEEHPENQVEDGGSGAHKEPTAGELVARARRHKGLRGQRTSLTAPQAWSLTESLHTQIAALREESWRPAAHVLTQPRLIAPRYV